MKLYEISEAVAQVVAEQKEEMALLRGELDDARQQRDAALYLLRRCLPYVDRHILSEAEALFASIRKGENK